MSKLPSFSAHVNALKVNNGGPPQKIFSSLFLNEKPESNK